LVELILLLNNLFIKLFLFSIKNNSFKEKVSLIFPITLSLIFPITLLNLHQILANESFLAFLDFNHIFTTFLYCAQARKWF
jgi:hypothetical protein